MEQMSTQYKILHLEPTDACQAACPQCAREFDTAFNKDNLHHLTMNQVNDLISDDVIMGLDKMYMCGVYGDPAAGKFTLDIYRYFRHVNPKITLGMNSNGGLRTESWWRELATIFKRSGDYVVFSIDGLEDTNDIYRVNVKWHKIMENAKAFIGEGGSAHWDMLVFEHNEHQVEDCERLARELGFKWFRAKVSRRNDLIPINFLHPPKGWKNPVVHTGNIRCQALEENSVYVSAKGELFPCCYLGMTPYTLDQFESIKATWHTDTPNQVCNDTCLSTDGQSTPYLNQWQREVQF